MMQRFSRRLVMILSTASATLKVSIASANLVYIRSAKKRKDKGNAIMIKDESIQKKSNKQLEQERLSHEEAIRLQEQIDEEERKRIARDVEIAKQLQEEYDKAGKKEAIAEVDAAHVIDWNDPSVIKVNTGRTKLSTARPKLSTNSTKIESIKLEAMVEERRIFKCWFHYHITNGHQFTMSNRHQELASPEQTTSELASPKQTTLGKDISNPLIVDSLLKTIWLSMHHVIAMKRWLFQSKRLLLLRCYDDDKD
ncbi:hypothetical protein Tco_1067012 [Tanacetum coccineum]|uniref:Clathrin light chain n=1 Tax=Tanacetum coccineum TaxID=301880 RepID=A0ABQ5HBN2_9ASTR